MSTTFFSLWLSVMRQYEWLLSSDRLRGGFELCWEGREARPMCQAIVFLFKAFGLFAGGTLLWHSKASGQTQLGISSTKRIASTGRKEVLYLQHGSAWDGIKNRLSAQIASDVNEWNPQQETLCTSRSKASKPTQDLRADKNATPLPLKQLSHDSTTNPYADLESKELF